MMYNTYNQSINPQIEHYEFFLTTLYLYGMAMVFILPITS